MVLSQLADLLAHDVVLVRGVGVERRVAGVAGGDACVELGRSRLQLASLFLLYPVTDWKARLLDLITLLILVG